MSLLKNKPLSVSLKEFAQKATPGVQMWLVSNLNEIRELYNSNEKNKKILKETMEELEYQIFNSIFNRVPNFLVVKVLKDKLEYAIGWGIGYRSLNHVPLSWIVGFKNFLMNLTPITK